MRRVLWIALVCACSVPDKDPSEMDDETWLPGQPIETTITAAPSEFSNTGTATFEFESNHPSPIFECSVDGATPAPCTSPFSRALGQGSHTFSVRATDGNGLGDDTPAEHVWSIDTAAPETTLTEAPPASDNSTMVMFAFNSNEMNVVFECRLDGAAFVPCRSGDTFGPIADGAHAFAVRAKDRAGNVDGTPATHAWHVDTSTPDTTLLTGPQNSSPSDAATFTFVSPDAGAGATFECSLDGGAFVGCVSPQTYTGLTMGVHTFQVRVRDVVGNYDPTPAMDTWTVDLTAPETTITSGPSGTVAIASASFEFTADEVDVTFQCSVDGGAFAPCTSPFILTGLAQGPHSFAVTATDGAGHQDASPASATWTVDTSAPDLMIVSGPSDGTTSGPRVTFMFTVTEGTTECSLDGAAFGPCSNPISYSLPAGGHSFAVRSTDGAGNTTSVARSWTVVCAAPEPAGAAGLLHLDDSGQILANATGGASATLGPTDQGEGTDPVAISGRFAGALGFTASEGDLVAWPAALGAVSDITIELWARPDGIAGTRDVLVSGDGRVAIRVMQDSATTVRFLATFVDSSSVMHTAVSQPVVAGGWHWVLVSLDEPTLRLWVDGTATNVGSVSLGTAPALDTIRLGGSYGGALDEVYVSLAATPTDDAALNRYCPL